jgi:hypothetical protein
LKIPSRKTLYRDIEYIKIYNYVKEHGFTFDSIRCASRIYNKELSFVKRAVAKVSKCVDGQECDIASLKDDSGSVDTSMDADIDDSMDMDDIDTEITEVDNADDIED